MLIARCEDDVTIVQCIIMIANGIVSRAIQIIGLD